MVRDQFTRSDTAPLAIADAGTLTNPDPRAGQAAGDPFVIDGTSYTVVREVHWNLTEKGTSACTGGTLVIYPTLGVTVSVTWPHMGSVKPVVSTAALAPSKGNGIPGTASFVAVKVTDAADQPSVGRTVKVTGGTETKIGTTDASGCAVLQVSPAAGAGTSYVAQVTDAGYVTPAGVTGPSLSVGTLTQGQLNNSVHFTYDLAAHLTLRLVDGSGTPLPAGSVTSSQVTLTFGSSSVPTMINGVTATIDNLWPGTYGAYYGLVIPSQGYGTVHIGPGATGNLDVSVIMATGSFTGTPAGTTTLTAVPGGTADCSGAGAVTVDPAGFTLLPGSWSFFANGSTFACSPGPGTPPPSGSSTGLGLVSGDNGSQSWGTTTLNVTGAPSGDLWAVSRSKATGVPISSTSCPDPSYAPVALDVRAARNGFIPIPAGDWYVYVTAAGSGAAGPCVGVPYNLYSSVIPYNTATTLAWAFQPALVKVTGAPPSYNSYAMLVSSSSAVPSCSRTSPGSSSYSTIPPSGSAYVGSLNPGTWYFYSWNQNYYVSGPRCVYGGKVIVGGASTYTLPFSTTAPVPVVGP